MKRGTGAIRMGIACAMLFGSLSLVVWRQGRALDELRGLDAARSARALLQAERSELQRSIRLLESRSRIAAVAGERLGLRNPTRSEIVFLRSPSETAPLNAMIDGDGKEQIERGLLTAAERR